MSETRNNVKQFVSEILSDRFTLSDMVDMGRIAEDLRALRKSKNLSTRALAEKIDISYATVQAIEKKQRAPKITVLDAWLNHFGKAMIPYLNEMADSEELDSIAAQRETIRLLKIALVLPEKRKALEGFIDALLADEKRSEKSQK